MQALEIVVAGPLGARGDAVLGSAGSGARRGRRDDLDEAGVRRRVEAARAGDGEAFGELFRAFRRDVLRLCERLLGSRADAEDALNETFLRVRHGLDGYDARRPFRPWLLAIASNHALDRLRRRDTERRLFVCDPGEELPAPGPSPLQGELDASRRRVILGAIDALPDRYRAPLVLRYYVDLDHDAIAGMLGVTRNQVATLLFRARRRLRAQLAELLEDAP